MTNPDKEAESAIKNTTCFSPPEASSSLYLILGRLLIGMTNPRRNPPCKKNNFANNPTI